MSIFVWTGIDYAHADHFKGLLLWDVVPLSLLTGDREPWRIGPSQIDLRIDAAGVDEGLLAFFQDAFDFESRLGLESGGRSMACSIVRGLDSYPKLIAKGDVVCVKGAHEWDCALVASYARGLGAKVYHVQPGILNGTYEASELPMVPGETEPELVTLFRAHRMYGQQDVRNHAIFSSHSGNGEAFFQTPDAWAGYLESERIWNASELYDLCVIGQRDDDPELVMANVKEFPTTKELCTSLAQSNPNKRVLYRPGADEPFGDASSLADLPNVWFAPTRLRALIGRTKAMHVLSSGLGAELQLIGFPVTWHAESWYRKLGLETVENRFRFLSLARKYYCPLDSVFDNIWTRIEGETRQPSSYQQRAKGSEPMPAPGRA